MIFSPQIYRKIITKLLVLGTKVENMLMKHSEVQQYDILHLFKDSYYERNGDQKSCHRAHRR